MDKSQTDATKQRTVQPELSGKLKQKMRYLDEITSAINKFDDRRVYELVDPQEYATLVRGNKQTESTHLADLVQDVHPDLSHYLSTELIKYLRATYSFFFFEETKLGDFDIFFGNWWDRRLFGRLDVLNAKLVFDGEEYDKLTQSFALEAEGKNYNSDRIKEIAHQSQELQSLVENQDERDQEKETLRGQLKEVGESRNLFNGGHAKSERQTILDQLTKLADEDDKANNAYKGMKANEDESLVLSKEDTILSYEKQAIRKVFGSFENFKTHNENLYVDYLNSLISKGIEDGTLSPDEARPAKSKTTDEDDKKDEVIEDDK
ncbi:exonuclease SbcC [Furfurilactobacillus siliginis]|uniref:Exonuclease SbcC n=1 Tax=Furfurilactobacillus siliginis TaxID=348151 RepID=A0A0R2L015_9LACO|nr:exonuclease SbcC [Furfurilactobacillus siliginis]KRN95059.1 hypothetical protein IV55_GL000340 [Furfurilactobacillus siliginis]GEK28313.1 hypothetical protein LSI01_06240 [Furfurilactobacillus siliginis]